LLHHLGFRATAAAVCALFITACSGAHQSFVPTSTANETSSRHAMTGATALPGTGATALPGTGATALPGTGATALPGANYACTMSNAQQQGVAACTVAINTNIAVNSNPNAAISSLLGYAPTDIANAYGIPASTSSATVAIVDAFDDPNAETELGVYRSMYGLPECTSANGCFTKVNQSGAASNYPQNDSGWSTEIALDLDMVSAVCPTCKILLVEANTGTMDDLGASVDTAVRMGANVVSNSYYTAEYSDESSEDVHYNHPGVAITASSGDRTSSSYPAASHYVTSVSGTSLNHNGSWSQSPWQYAGHGCSPYIARPGWQHGRTTNCDMRASQDVAVVADPQTGVSVFSMTQGGWVVVGGTSVGAPIVAAMYALSGNYVSPGYSYAHSSLFTPVGAAGYDPTTGLGSPNGVGGL
jgi:subtilase family serine protease